MLPRLIKAKKCKKLNLVSRAGSKKLIWGLLAEAPRGGLGIVCLRKPTESSSEKFDLVEIADDDYLLDLNSEYQFDYDIDSDVVPVWNLKGSEFGHIQISDVNSICVRGGANETFISLDDGSVVARDTNGMAIINWQLKIVQKPVTHVLDFCSR